MACIAFSVTFSPIYCIAFSVINCDLLAEINCTATGSDTPDWPNRGTRRDFLSPNSQLAEVGEL